MVMNNKQNKTVLKKKKSAQFDTTEVYRQLRTNVEFSSFGVDLKIISITSTKPSEGKSTVANNLAIMFAIKYDDVLLIDCDLRRPTQHKLLKGSNVVGVSNLTKNIDSFDVNDDNNYQRFKGKDMGGKLYFIPAGSKVPNPQELLASEKFHQLIEKLKTRFKYIIIDCPPIYAVSDAVPVANISDGTIFVVSAKETDKKEAKSALKQLERNGANIIGCVLNKVESKSVHAYGYY